jgi:surface protein
VIGDWCVKLVTDMQDMFAGASSFNSDISRWDVSSVTSMEFMFNGASSFNSDVSSWNVNSVTDMEFMFDDASSFNQNLCPWGPKLPANFNYTTIGAAYAMFSLSGCANQNKPTGPTGPWCAVTYCTANP